MKLCATSDRCTGHYNVFDQGDLLISFDRKLFAAILVSVSLFQTLPNGVLIPCFFCVSFAPSATLCYAMLLLQVAAPLRKAFNLNKPNGSEGVPKFPRSFGSRVGSCKDDQGPPWGEHEKGMTHRLS